MYTRGITMTSQSEIRTFLWLTSFMRTNSRYALLACVTFWNGRLSFLIATFSLVTESYAALTTPLQAINNSRQKNLVNGGQETLNKYITNYQLLDKTDFTHTHSHSADTGDYDVIKGCRQQQY